MLKQDPSCLPDMPPADCPSRAGAPSPDHVNTAMFAATPAALPLLRRAAQMLERRPDLAGDQEARSRQISTSHSLPRLHNSDRPPYSQGGSTRFE